MNRLGDSYRYKNSTAKILKEGEIQRSINPAGGSSGGSHLVAASALYDAFVSAGNDVIARWRGDDDDVDSSAATVQPCRLVNCHTDDITDIAFSPFNDEILATAAKNAKLKLWSLSSSSSSSSSPPDNSPTLSISVDGPLSALQWHPAASGVVTAAIDDGVSILDVEKAEVALKMEPAAGAKIQSLSWGKLNGSLLATTSSDKMVGFVCWSLQLS